MSFVEDGYPEYPELIAKEEESEIPWIASDGSHWVYQSQTDEWSGWMPGEDGVWIISNQEFQTLRDKS